MKKNISLILAMSIIMSLFVPMQFVKAAADVWDGTTVDTSWSGSGTESEPYLITSGAELAGLANVVNNAATTDSIVATTNLSASDSVYDVYKNTYFRITTDINLDDNEWTPIGTKTRRFCGIVNTGADSETAGIVVENVKISQLNNYIGFFGRLGDGAKISDIGLENVDMTYTNAGGTTRVAAAGGFAAVVGTGEINNCYVKNVTIVNKKTDLSEGRVGGFIGAGYTAKNFSNDTNTNIKINNCYVMNPTITGSGNATHSGFVGHSFLGGNSNYRVTFFVNSCYVGGTADITSGAVSGFAQEQYAKLVATDCYSVGEVTNGLGAGSQSADVITAALADNATWWADGDNVNEGFPVLTKPQNVIPIPTVEPTPTPTPTPSPTPTPTPTPEPGEDMFGGAKVDTEFSGEGTEASPYLITTASELAGLSYLVNKTSTAVTETLLSDVVDIYKGTYFRITNDIDLGNNEWTPIGTRTRRFAGTITTGDGIGKTGIVISNLKITKLSNYLGLFGRLGEGVKISDIGLENVDITYTNAGGDKRVSAAAGFAAVVGTGEINNCYVKDVTIVNKKTDTNEGKVGGFIATGYNARNYSNDDNTNITVNNCYVVNFTSSGSGSAARSGFVGDSYFSNYPNQSSNYRIAFKLNNCYVGGTVNMTAGAISGFARQSNGSNVHINNCYSVAEITNGFGTGGQTAAQIAENMATVDGYVTDNTIVPINNGYPVLKWQAEWLNDSTTTLLHDYFLNEITNGQSDKYVFDNLNFIDSVEHGGKAYKVGWTSQNYAVIDDSGNVTLKKEATDVVVNACIRCRGSDVSERAVRVYCSITRQKACTVRI